MWPFIVVTLLIVAGVLLLRGPPELARLTANRGTVRLKRGRLPGPLFHDFEDILRDQAIEDAALRIVVENGRPCLVARGLDAAHQQQLRNVLGPYTVSQIRAGRRTPHAT